MRLRFRHHNLWFGLVISFYALPLILVFQNCTGGGFSTKTLDTPSDQSPLPLSTASCTLPTSNGNESHPAGSKVSGYLKETVTFPESCTKATRTCNEQGEWDGPVPLFSSCQQKCLNPSTSQMENCPSNPAPPKPVTKWPAWRQNMRAWEWKKIEDSDLSTAIPLITVTGSLNSIIDANNGLAADPVTNRLYSAANGGGTDYSGNEVYEIDLSSETPKWRVLRQPTSNDSIFAGDASMNIFNDYYKDNRPASTHTYYALQFISAKQSIFKFGAGSTWGTGAEGNVKTDAFSIPFNDWFAPGTFPDITSPRTSTREVSICKNPLTEEVYVNLDRLRKFDPTKDSYIPLALRPEGSTATDDSGGGCAVDSKRSKILFFKNKQSPTDGGFLYDIASDTMKTISFSGPALRNMRDAIAGYGYFDPTFDVYIFKDQLSGGHIYRINPDTFEIHQVITSGGDAIPEATNGVYTKFTQLPNLKGYAYYPKYGSGIWFLATE